MEGAYLTADFPPLTGHSGRPLPVPASQNPAQSPHHPLPPQSRTPLAHAPAHALPAEINGGHHLPQPHHVNPKHFQQYPPEALEKNLFGDGGDGYGGYSQITQPGQPAFPPSHPYVHTYPMETVFMDVPQGMTVSMGQNPDGSPIIHNGPCRVPMTVPLNQPPPIEAPPGHQAMWRVEQDPYTGGPVRIYCVVPIQQFPDQYVPNPHQMAQNPIASEPVPNGQIPPHLVNQPLNQANQAVKSPDQSDTGTDLSKGTTTPPIRGGDTDEEKKNIKQILSTMDPPRLEEVGIDFVSLKWNAVKEPEGKEVDFLDKVSYMVEIQNTGGKERWSSAYQGKKTHATCENLQSGCEYFSRARYLNIEGEPSGTVLFSTEVKQPQSPKLTSRRSKTSKTTSERPLAKPENLKVREKSSTYLVLEWSSPRGYNGRVSYVLQMADFDPTSAETSKFKMIYDGKDSQFTVSKLRRATKYRFRVQATSDVGSSGFTSFLDATTSPEAPSQLYKPSLNKLEKMDQPPTKSNGKGRAAGKQRPGPYYYAELEWKAPKETGGAPIEEYRVQQRIADRNQSWEDKYKGPNQTTIIENLPPGSRIEFRVRAISAAGPSDWSFPELVNTKPGRPKPPKKITIEKVGTCEAVVSWSVGLCVTGGSVLEYELRLAETGYYDARSNSSDISTDDKDEKEEDSRIQFKNQNKQARECTLTQLKSGRRYKVHIRTINSGSEKSEWNSMEFVTLSDRPGAPDSISVTAVQSESVSIEWKEPNSNGSPITGYFVDISGDGVQNKSVGVSSTRLDQTNLEANTVYKFKVAATNAIGRSDFSPACSIRTLASIPHIPVLNIKLDFSIPVTRQAAQLKWNTPSDQGSKICGYRVESRWSSGEQEYSVLPDETELRIPDLEPDQSYRFRIQAINERGASPFSDWGSLRTRPLPPVAPVLNATDIHPNSVKLQWSATGAKYMLQVEKQSTRSFWKEIYRGEKQVYKAPRLQEGTVYRFRVAASNNSGDGHFSTPVEISTPRAPPPNIKGAPTVEILEETECAQISWTLPNSHQLTDLKFKLDVLRDGKTIRTIPNISRTDFKLENLEREKNYSVRVVSIRNGQQANFSPQAHFLINKKTIKENETPETDTKTRIIDQLPTIWADDSVTALLLFAFAIVAVLIALCGHHWQKPPGGN